MKKYIKDLLNAALLATLAGAVAALLVDALLGPAAAAENDRGTPEDSQIFTTQQAASPEQKLPDDLTAQEKKELEELMADTTLSEREKERIKAFWLAHRRADGTMGTMDEKAVQQAMPAQDTKQIFGDGSRKGVFDKVQNEAESIQNSLAALLGLKFEGRENPTPQQIREDMDKIKGMFQVTSPLKVNMLFAVEASPGNMMFFSENGRFFFKGTMYDAFNGMKALKNIDDVRTYALKTDYRKLKLDPESLSSARIGDGPRQVVIYVDPASDMTHDIIDKVMKYPDKKLFTFYFVVIPSDSEKSKNLAKAFYCARQANNPEAGNLLYRGGLDRLSTAKCPMENWQNTITAAYYTQVDVLPFFVGDDGRISRGEPSEGLYNWLSAQTMPVLEDAFKNESELNWQRRNMQNITRSVTKQEATREEAAQAQQNYKAPAAIEEEEEEEYGTLDAYVDSYRTTPEPKLPEGTPETMPDDEEILGQIEVNRKQQAQDDKSTQAEYSNPSSAIHNQHTERQLMSSGEIVEDPTQTVDTSGFDMTDEINRYFQEAEPTDDENLVVNGLDQGVAEEVAGDKEARAATLSDFTQEDLDKQLDSQELRRKDRNLLEEIQALKAHVKRIQNEFTQQREDARRRYDRDFQSYEAAYYSTRFYGDAKRERRQAEIRERQEIIKNRYHQKLDQLDRAEQAALQDTVAEIKYLERGLISK